MVSSFTHVFQLVLAASFVAAAPYSLRVAHQQQGILTLSFDPAKAAAESIELVSTTQAGFRPQWLLWRDKQLHSISRSKFPSNCSTSAGIFTFDRDADGGLHLANAARSFGNGGVHINISPDGRNMAAANIDGSTVSIFPRNATGLIHDPSHVFHYELFKPGPGHDDSQEQSNPHAVVFDPTGQLLVVPDRGADAVYVYSVLDAENVIRRKDIKLPPGTGPRHVVFAKQSATRSLLFLLGELDNTINAFSVEVAQEDEDAPPSILHLQTISTLGLEGATEPLGHDLSSELELSSDQRFIYSSNRNTQSVDSPDSLAIFSVNLDLDKPLQFVGLNSTHGKIPRHFSLSPDDNQFVAVANQVTNDLYIMKRNSKTGLIGDIVGNYIFGALDLTTELGPVAVVWDERDSDVYG